MFGISPMEILIVAAVVGIFVLVPLAVVVAVLLLGGRNKHVSSPNLFPCPDCGRTISRNAPSCPHCGRPCS